MRTEPPDPVRQALMELLDAGLRYAPFYGPGYVDHLPMALCALQGLGADAARLDRYGAQHAGHLGARAAPAAPPADHGEWLAALGRPDSFEMHAAYAATLISRDGREAALRRLLPELLADPGAALFHGMIRTAHAVDAAHDGELAAGLGVWAARWQAAPAAATEARAGDLDCAAWLQGLRDLRPRLDAAARAALRRRAARGAPAEFEAAAGALRIDGGTLAQIARVAAGLFARSGDFVALHVVTGSRALRVLSRWASDDARRRFARAAAAAWLAEGAFDGDQAPKRAIAGGGDAWARIAAAATEEEDEHVIKIVHASRELDAAFGGAEFANAALRALPAAARRRIAGAQASGRARSV